MEYDLIVIGAGPAGATAAWTAARSGLKVALIEKQPLPRHKTCGGGMPLVAGELLPEFQADGIVEAKVEFMRHSYHFQDAHLAPINPPGVVRPLALWMVQRSIFDNAVAQRATQAGAELRDGLLVKEIVPDATGVTVRAESNAGVTFSARASWVIGADGANGPTSRAAGIRQNRTLAIGIEVEHPHRWGDGHEHLRPDVLHLEYGAVPRGYAWVFPKGDHLNVGAGVFRLRRVNGRGEANLNDVMRQAIWNYLKSLGVPFDSEKMQYFGHPLPIWDGKERLQSKDDRILLCGDAAGLINPLFGDGILHAIRSGRMAGEAVASGITANYTTTVHEHFAADFDAALKLAKFFYRFPGVCYRHGVKREMATHMAARLLYGDALFSDIAGRAIRKFRSGMLKGAQAE